MKKKYFKIPKYKGAAIYGIVNIDDMKIYIGKTKNVQNRAKQHLAALESGKHANKALQRDEEKYLRFLVLYNVPDQEIKYMNLLEKIYMLGSIYRGYNLYNVAGPCNSEELRRAIVNDALYYFNAEDNIENSIFNEYKSHTWNIKNMRYKRERYLA